MRRLTWILILVALPLSAGDRKAFVWASRPAEAQYTADATYSWSSSGGAITITHGGTGVYSVTFAGLGGAKAGGNVQVTPYGAEPRTCSIVNWSGAPDLVVSVHCFGPDGSRADSNFSMLVSWQPETLRVVPGAMRFEAKAQKTVKPDGTVVRRYPDRIVESFRGGRRITYFDGRPTETMLYNTGAPSNLPPTPPDDAERRWLTWHGERLIDVMRSLVGNDDASITNYLTSEASNLTVYERINRRRDTINLLLGE